MIKDKSLCLAILGDASHPDVNRWCRGLAEAGADVHLLSINTRNAFFTPLYPLKIPNIPYKLHYIFSVLEVKRQLSIIKPDVLICYDITGYGTLGTLTNFHPIVQMMVGSDILLQARQSLMGKIVRWVISRSDLVTTLAPHMAEAGYQSGAKPEKTVIIPLGIDLSLYYSHTEKSFHSDSPIRIISTRSLKPFYNIDKVIRAVKLLQEWQLNCHLTIVGGGSHRLELENLVHELELEDHVDFLGFVPNSELPDILKHHDYYVSLSPSDGVSSSLLEAMGLGLFPIVSSHPANSHWISDEANGILLADLSPFSLATALKRASSDTDLRRRAYYHNLKVVENQADLSINAQRYIEALKSSLGINLEEQM